MDRRLLPINAWIALLTGQGRWPTPLGDQGFEILRLEVPVSTERTNVTVDGLAVNVGTGVVLPTECKSGSNVDAEQAERYSVMRLTDIRRQVTLPREAGSAEVQPIYACLEEDAERVERGLDSESLAFPLLVVGDEQVELRRGNEFVESFSVLVPSPPPRIVVVDAESSAEEYRELLLPEIIAASSRGVELISVESLLKDAVPYLEAFGGPAMRRIRGASTEALRALANGEFRDVFRVEPGDPHGQGAIIRVLESPATYDARGEAQGWQRQRRKGERSLRGRATRVMKDQMSFEDLARESERGEK